MRPLQEIAYNDIFSQHSDALIKRLIDGGIFLITDVAPIHRLQGHDGNWLSLMDK